MCPLPSDDTLNTSFDEYLAFFINLFNFFLQVPHKFCCAPRAPAVRNWGGGHVGTELQEIYCRVATYINQLWQQAWNNESTGRHFYSVQPDVASRDRILFETSLEVRRSPHASTPTRKMHTQLLSAQNTAADAGTCDRCGKQKLSSTISTVRTTKLQRQENLRPTEDQLHIADDSPSGSGSRCDPSPDSPTVVRVNHGSEA